LVIDDLEVFAVAVKSDVRPAITVEIGDHEGREPFVRGDGIDAKAGVGRQFIDFQFPSGFGRLIGLAGLVEQDVDLRTQVVGGDQRHQERRLQAAETYYAKTIHPLQYILYVLSLLNVRIKGISQGRQPDSAKKSRLTKADPGKTTMALLT